jgi:hypothetical protein
MYEMENAEFIGGEEIPETEPPKKRRGRPKKTDAQSETDIPVDDKPKRKYAKRKKFDDEDKSNLARQLVGIHQMIAITGGLPEMIISDTEAIMMANALTSVATEYNLSLSGKTGAMIQLLGTAAFIYVPRMSAINRRKRTTEPKTDITVIDPNDTANSTTVN